MEDLPDDYNKLQSLAKENGKDDIIGATKDELIEFLKKEDISEEAGESNPSPSQQASSTEDEDTESDESSESSSPQTGKIEEHTVDLQKHLGDDEDEEEESDSKKSQKDKGTTTDEEGAAEALEDQLDGVDREGLDQAINNLWGRVWTIDKDPEDPEAENIRKNLSAMAEDVGLGKNAKYWAEENLFTEDEQSPTQALMVSLLMASVVSLGMREDLAKQWYEKAKRKAENSKKSEDSEDEDDQE